MSNFSASNDHSVKPKTLFPVCSPDNDTSSKIIFLNDDIYVVSTLDDLAVSDITKK